MDIPFGLIDWTATFVMAEHGMRGTQKCHEVGGKTIQHPVPALP